MQKPVKGADLAGIHARQKLCCEEKALPVSLTTHGLKDNAAYQTLHSQFPAEGYSLSKAATE